MSSKSTLVNLGQIQGQQSMLTSTRRVHPATRRVTRVTRQLVEFLNVLKTENPCRPKTPILHRNHLESRKWVNPTWLIELAKGLDEFLQSFLCSNIFKLPQSCRLQIYPPKAWFPCKFANVTCMQALKCQNQAKGGVLAKEKDKAW